MTLAPSLPITGSNQPPTWSFGTTGRHRTFLLQAWQRSDLVITTGSLGPTTDDITRESIAAALGEQLVFDPKIEISLNDRFSQLGKPMPEINLRQCYRPGNAEVLDNPYGTAPGLLLQKEGKCSSCFPDRRGKCIPCLNKLSFLQKKRGIFPEIDCYLQIRTAGIGESALAEKIEHLFEGSPGRGVIAPMPEWSASGSVPWTAKY